MKFALALTAFLVLFAAASVASACPACPDGMIQVDVSTPSGYHGLGMNNIGVVGYGCNYYWPNQISTKVKINEAGTYDVYGYVIRGQSRDCQASEDFFLSIAGIDGPVSEDDAHACASSVRLDFLGTFPLEEGKNLITMTSAANCPPDRTANSVELERLCIAPVPPSAPEFPTPLLAAAVFLATPGIAYAAKKKK